MHFTFLVKKETGYFSFWIKKLEKSSLRSSYLQDKGENIVPRFEVNRRCRFYHSKVEMIVYPRH